MQTVKLVFLGLVLLAVQGVALAQSSTNSPNSQYGYGNLADRAFISQRGMGGIGYGLRNSQSINSMNPAAFSAVDSMTFMFDLGISGQSVWQKENGIKEQKFNGNLEYIAMQFPLAKKLGFGAGFEPVSYVGYSYMETDTLKIPGDWKYAIYMGRGGFSKVYVDLSYEWWDRISVGVKLSYLFGDKTKNIIFSNSITGSNSTTTTDTLRAYGFLYDFGVQYHYSVGKFRTVTIGAIYSPKIRIGAKVMKGEISSGSTNITNIVSKDSVFEMPETFGLGFTYNRLGKVTAGADILYQRWAAVKYYDKTDTLNNRLKFNLGGEWIPNYTGTGILNRIRYRAGVYYANSYLNVKGAKYNEYGLTLGLGIPTPNRRSFVNLAFEYSRVKPDLKNFVDEQYFKISLSYTFNELWFSKLKVQ